MVINPNKTALGNLLDLVQLENPSETLVEADVTASAPLAIDPATNNNCDTKVVLSATGADYFTGQVEVHYSRLDLQRELDQTPGQVSVPADATQQQALDAIAAFYKLIPGEFEFTGTYAPPAAEDPRTKDFNIAGKASGSLLYLSKQVTVTLLYP